MQLTLNTILKATSKLLLVFVIFVSFVATCHCKSNDNEKPIKGKVMSNDIIAVKLDIQISERQILATLNFTNNADKPVFLDKINVCVDGHIRNDVFIIDSGDRSIEYSGVLIKRMKPGINDVVELQPGKILTTKVDLNESYEFLGETHNYKILYNAFHPFKDLKNTDYVELKSNEVKFTYKK